MEAVPRRLSQPLVHAASFDPSRRFVLSVLSLVLWTRRRTLWDCSLFSPHLLHVSAASFSSSSLLWCLIDVHDAPFLLPPCPPPPSFHTLSHTPVVSQPHPHPGGIVPSHSLTHSLVPCPSIPQGTTCKLEGRPGSPTHTWPLVVEERCVASIAKSPDNAHLKRTRSPATLWVGKQASAGVGCQVKPNVTSAVFIPPCKSNRLSSAE